MLTAFMDVNTEVDTDVADVTIGWFPPTPNTLTYFVPASVANKKVR
jgi:hypothetical protein